MEEIWKEVEGHKNYFISNLGRVKSTKRYPEGRILKLNMTKQGYYHIIFYDMENEKAKKVHRLVAEAFIPNPENKPQVNHIDGVKHNNVVTNLEWCTPRENQLHAIDMNLITHVKGENHGRVKLTEEQVIEILNNGKYDTYTNIGKKYGVGRKTIELILKRKKWTHIEGYEEFKPNIFNNKSSKLSIDDVKVIRSSTLSNKDLAKLLGVNDETIRKCRNYETFKNI